MPEGLARLSEIPEARRRTSPLLGKQQIQTNQSCAFLMGYRITNFSAACKEISSLYGSRSIRPCLGSPYHSRPYGSTLLIRSATRVYLCAGALRKRVASRSSYQAFG